MRKEWGVALCEHYYSLRSGYPSRTYELYTLIEIKCFGV